jgi:hypothetical protein
MIPLEASSNLLIGPARASHLPVGLPTKVRRVLIAPGLAPGGLIERAMRATNVIEPNLLERLLRVPFL